jgi:hypothetical protein
MTTLRQIAVLSLLALVAVGSGLFPESGTAMAGGNLDYRWYGRFHQQGDARSFADFVLTVHGAQIASVSDRDSRGVYYVLVAWRHGTAVARVPWRDPRGVTHLVHGVTRDPRQ